MTYQGVHTIIILVLTTVSDHWLRKEECRSPLVQYREQEITRKNDNGIVYQDKSPGNLFLFLNNSSFQG